MGNKYPFYGHDDGLVIDGPDTGFVERPMTAAELAAREPALKIARDIYRHANQAGVCYAEIWRIIADAFEQHAEALRLVRPFIAEDFPNGPDGDSCATPKYREAYKALVRALGTTQPGANES